MSWSTSRLLRFGKRLGVYFVEAAAAVAAGAFYNSGSTTTDPVYAANYIAAFPGCIVAGFTTPAPGAALFNPGTQVTISGAASQYATFAGVGSVGGGTDGLSGVGPFMWEMTVGGGADAYGYIGNPGAGLDPELLMYGFAGDAVYYTVDGQLWVLGVPAAVAASVDGDILGFVYESDTGTLNVFRNGVLLGSGVPSNFGFGPYAPVASRSV